MDSFSFLDRVQKYFVLHIILDVGGRWVEISLLSAMLQGIDEVKNKTNLT